MIADADVVATRPEHCENCGSVVMSVLVNDPRGTRRWVPAHWNSTAKAWAEHTTQNCERVKAEPVTS